MRRGAAVVAVLLAAAGAAWGQSPERSTLQAYGIVPRSRAEAQRVLLELATMRQTPAFAGLAAPPREPGTALVPACHRQTDITLCLRTTRRAAAELVELARAGGWRDFCLSAVDDASQERAVIDYATNHPSMIFQNGPALDLATLALLEVSRCPNARG